MYARLGDVYTEFFLLIFLSLPKKLIYKYKYIKITRGSELPSGRLIFRFVVAAGTKLFHRVPANRKNYGKFMESGGREFWLYSDSSRIRNFNQ